MKLIGKCCFSIYYDSTQFIHSIITYCILPISWRKSSIKGLLDLFYTLKILFDRSYCPERSKIAIIAVFSLFFQCSWYWVSFDLMWHPWYLNTYVWQYNWWSLQPLISLVRSDDNRDVQGSSGAFITGIFSINNSSLTVIYIVLLIEPIK